MLVGGTEVASYYLSTPMRKFTPTLNSRFEVYLGQEVKDARTKAQVPSRINN